jgi:hypothetical protein
MEVRIDSLQPWDKNPREIDDKHFELLKQDIIKHPETIRLLIDGRDQKTILGGNMRFKAIKDLGWEDVEVCIVDIKDDQDALEVALRDNMQYGRYIEEKLVELVTTYPDMELSNYEIDIKPVSLKYFETPNFEAIRYNEDERLDKKKEKICPNCGYEIAS